MHRATLLLVAVLALPACDSRSPTEILGGVQTFEGSIPAAGSAIHSFTVTREGGVQVEVSSITVDPPRNDPTLLVSLALGIGRPADTGDCFVTFLTTIFTGAKRAFAVESVDYCFEVIDRGSLAEGELGVYAFTVSPSG